MAVQYLSVSAVFQYGHQALIECLDHLHVPWVFEAGNHINVIVADFGLYKDELGQKVPLPLYSCFGDQLIFDSEIDPVQSQHLYTLHQLCDVNLAVIFQFHEVIAVRIIANQTDTFTFKAGKIDIFEGLILVMDEFQQGHLTGHTVHKKTNSFLQTTTRPE